MMSSGSNRLPHLATEIRQAHADVQHAAKTAAGRAIDAGRALIEAKSLAKHGEWLTFLKDAGTQERTAQRYMTLAASDLQSDTVSLLGGITPALRFLRLRKSACQYLNEAEAAAGADLPESEAVPPIEAAMDLIEEMVAMFPPEAIGRAA